MTFWSMKMLGWLKLQHIRMSQHNIKVETSYHWHDLILILIILPQSGWHWIWSCPELHMGGFSDGGWQFLTFGRCHLMELPILNIYIINISRHSYCFTIAPLFGLDTFVAWNRCLQYPCFKNLCNVAQASSNSDSSTQHFLSNLLTHSWFTPSSLHSQVTAMNKCFYLMHGWVCDCGNSECAVWEIGTRS